MYTFTITFVTYRSLADCSSTQTPLRPRAKISRPVRAGTIRSIPLFLRPLGRRTISYLNSLRLHVFASGVYTFSPITFFPYVYVFYFRCMAVMSRWVSIDSIGPFAQKPVVELAVSINGIRGNGIRGNCGIHGPVSRNCGIHGPPRLHKPPLN